MNSPPEFLEHLTGRDLVWVEGDADLTPRRRETFTAWSKDRFRAFSDVGEATHSMMDVGASTRKMMEGFKLPDNALGNWLRSVMPSLRPAVFARPRDPLGDDIRKTIRELDDLLTPSIKSPLHHAKRRHDEQQESLRQLYEATDGMRQLMLQLVARTEQQHQAAERQKTTNWLLACIVVASMIGTLRPSRARPGSGSLSSRRLRSSQ